MKKLIAVILILVVLVPAYSFADLPDISGLSYDELVQLKDNINLAMWNSDKWQEVTVPIGVWTIGEDIPVGHWTISVDKNSSRDWVSITYCDLLDESGLKAGNMFSANIYFQEYIGKPGYHDGKYPESVNIDFKPGTYFIVQDGSVTFTPYTGKPDLGFK